MTRNQFATCVSLARDYSRDLSTVDDSAIFGCGLPGFKPIFVTREQVAKFVRWQCSYIYGASGFDGESLAECADIARAKFTLV
jgi:hypothetical protein